MMRRLGSLGLVAMLALMGCTPGNLRPDGDQTGDLGTEQRQSPADVYVKLGVAYMRNGDMATALQKLKKGLEVDDGNAEAHNAIGLVYMQLGEKAPARRHLMRAVSLKPKNPYFHNALGTFLCADGEYEEALRHFDQAIANPLYPTPWVAESNAGMCALRKGELERADGYFRKVLQRDPRQPVALLNMARISLAKGNYLSARAYLQRLSAVAEPTPESLLLGVRAEEKLGNRKRALRYAAQLKKRFPDSDQAKALEESTK